MPSFQWSTSRRRYLDAKGKLVSEKRVRNALDATIAAAKARIDALGEGLAASDVDAILALRAEIRAGHRAAALLAYGGTLPASMRGRLGAAVKKQYGYLDDFLREIEGGTAGSAKRIVARAKLYMDAVRGTYQQMVRVREQAAGMGEERRVLSPAEHCDDCVAAAKQGWQPMGTLPPIGDSACRVNCKCHFEYR